MELVNSNKGVKKGGASPPYTVKHNVAVRLVTEANNQAAARSDLRLTLVNAGHARAYKQFVVC